jgi:hypothetical protein
MRFRFWEKEKREDVLPLRPVDLAIQSGVQNLSAFTVDEREEILNGIAARAFPQKRHLHRNPRTAEKPFTPAEAGEII